MGGEYGSPSENTEFTLSDLERLRKMFDEAIIILPTGALICGSLLMQKAGEVAKQYISRAENKPCKTVYDWYSLEFIVWGNGTNVPIFGHRGF